MRVRRPDTVERGMIEQHFGGILDSFVQASKNHCFRHPAQTFPEEHIKHLWGKLLVTSPSENVSKHIMQDCFRPILKTWVGAA
jgi:hypothetical protein